MASCKDCIHRELCNVHGYIDADECGVFKNKANVEEVVRCKDCKYWRTEHGGFCEASNALCEVNNADNDFCSYGERRS